MPEPVDVALRDGSTVTVRPVLASDADALRGLLRGLSADSQHLRFFTGGADLSRAATGMTALDPSEGRGLVAVTGEPERIVAHAGYVRENAERAEVAFEVADEWHGRGVATVLLAHLSALAALDGVETFTATVLPENHKMIRVFRDSGFAVDIRTAPGELVVELPAALGDDARARFEDRDRTTSAAAVAHVLRPASVAVIGASARAGSVGAAILGNLRRSGYRGRLSLVNPRGGTIGGLEVHRTIADAPAPVELAVVAVPAAAVPAVARECGAAGVRALVVVSAGFAETGPEGAARQAALLDACRASGMRLVGPNCLGVLNTAPGVALDATFSLRAPPRGRLAVASQSGAFGIAAVAEAARRGLGLSSFVSMGNKADLSTNDLLQYWEGDADTDAVLLYLESFGNPRRFGRIARRVAAQKPVIGVKSGRSAAGARAAASHTGALLAASDAAYGALFRHAGVIRAGTVGEQFDIATLLASQPLPAGDRVAILTNAGGPGIACADACEAAGLRVEPLSEQTRRRLSHLPPEASLANPVDMIASAGGEDYRRSVLALAADPDVDAIVVVFVPALATGATDAARGVAAAAAAMAAGDTPLLAVWIAEDDRSLAALGAGDPGVPAYRTPEDAVRALAQVREYARRRTRSAEPPAPLTGVDADAAAATLARALAEGDAWLPPERVAALLDAYGIPQARSRTARTAAGVARCAAELDGPLAVKAIAPGLVHKSDVDGVRLGVAGAAAAGRAAREVATAVRGAGAEPTGFLVQEMAPEGVEMLVGVAGDPDLGSVVVCAAGGRAVELLGDAQMRLAPLTARDATEMIRELRTFPLLDGYRGASRADVAALEDVLSRVSALAADHPEIAELDCNPVLVAPQGATVVDARVRVAPVAPARPLPSLDR